VQFLTNLSSTVFFSAAIPRQGGRNHLNEQWQSYWIRKFSQYGYKAFDVVRPRFWDESQVALHYKQNAFIFSKAEEVISKLSGHDQFIADVVHPWHYLPVTEPEYHLSTRNVLTKFPSLFFERWFDRIAKSRKGS